MDREHFKVEKDKLLEDGTEEIKRPALKRRITRLESVISHPNKTPKTKASPRGTLDPNDQVYNRRFWGMRLGSKPSPSQASTLSEGGMTTCDDGGQSLERTFLDANSGRLRVRNYATATHLVESIRDDLNADGTKFESEAPPHTFFIPCTALYSIINQATVGLLLLKLYPGEDLGDMTKEVLAPSDPDSVSSQKTIAILILIGKEANLRWFYQKHINDSNLPFDIEKMKHPRSEFAELGWKPVDFQNFCSARREVSPVFFAVSQVLAKEKIVHYQCRSDEILPFMRQIPIAKGGYGEVSSYDLHEAQQNLHRRTKDGANRRIAVKRLFRTDTSIEFQQEYGMLDRLNHLDTPHIAKLLGTFEVPIGKVPIGPQSYNYFLMFEYADSTLSKIWEMEPECWGPGVSSEEIAIWVASQAYGLTVALNQLHDFGKHKLEDDTNLKTHGIHGDLKPDNILHFKNWKDVNEPLGVLQITDFGLSSFHQTQSAEDIVLLRGTSDYRPPEAAILNPLSASFDTWSLGCLFLEFLIWLVSGKEALKQFRTQRKQTPGFNLAHPCFWQAIELEKSTYVSLSSVVKEWAVNLYEHPNSSPFVRDFCELIINRMLVIEGSKPGNRKCKESSQERVSGDTTQTRRIGTYDLAEELKIFTERVEPNYFTPSPMSEPHKMKGIDHCIELPFPLYTIWTGALERRMKLQSKLLRV